MIRFLIGTVNGQKNFLLQYYHHTCTHHNYYLLSIDMCYPFVNWQTKGQFESEHIRYLGVGFKIKISKPKLFLGREVQRHNIEFLTH